jgi:hypothetical protein
MSAESQRSGIRARRAARRNSGGTGQPDLWQAQVAPLAEGVRTQRLIHGKRGFAIVYHGPAAEASVQGTMDGCEHRPNRWREYTTVAEREAYEYGYGQYEPNIEDRVTPKRPITATCLHLMPGQTGTMLECDVELVLVDWDGVDVECARGPGVDWVYAADVEKVQ